MNKSINAAYIIKNTNSLPDYTEVSSISGLNPVIVTKTIECYCSRLAVNRANHWMHMQRDNVEVVSMIGMWIGDKFALDIKYEVKDDSNG